MTAPQSPNLPAEALAAAAMARLGAHSAPQLADALGMTGRNEPKKINNWLTGYAQPNFEHTLLLLAAVDLLRPDAEKRLQKALAQARKTELAAQKLVRAKPPQGKTANG